jgi:hypothetical protein
VSKLRGELPELPALPGAARGRLLREPAWEVEAAADRGISEAGHSARRQASEESARLPEPATWITGSRERLIPLRRTAVSGRLR